MSPEFGDELAALRPYLVRYGRTLSRDAERAEDLASEAICKAWRYRERFEPGTSMRAWTTFILRNVFLSEQRRKRWDGGYVEDMAALEPWQPAGQEDRVHLQDLERAMELLPREQAYAIIMVALCGTYEEAAVEMNVSEGTVKSRVARGRARLLELEA